MLTPSLQGICPPVTHGPKFLYKELDCREFGMGIQLDFAKVFDSIDHNILLSKPNHYRVRGVAHSLFTSYVN